MKRLEIGIYKNYNEYFALEINKNLKLIKNVKQTCNFNA